MFLSVTVCLLSLFPTGNSNTSKQGIDLQDVVFLLLSQPNSYHAGRADVFKRHLVEQAEAISDTPPRLIYLHDQWPQTGAWTMLPIVSSLVRTHMRNATWLFICEEETRVHLPRLLHTLSRYDAKKVGGSTGDTRPREPAITVVVT
ncbi:PREDICTED: beta-1,3-glucosyltransferase-like [Priapulus caudatus]|uniref:Beta-1,3-glucosyltransferase-like n=1 Tax=Priapulus caudatus TaxID=37621 RepID=A0ABM1EYZ0_PRICU|nr:PREDICTED: beta-1,3-glucosyltransferase-like [Priapulus caudatus]